MGPLRLCNHASATLVRDRSRHVTFNPDDTVDISGADSAPGGFRIAGAGQLELVTADERGQAEIVPLPRSQVSDRVRRRPVSRCGIHIRLSQRR